VNYTFSYMTNALLNNNCIPIRSKADMDFESDQRSFIYQSLHKAQYYSLVGCYHNNTIRIEHPF